MGTYNARILEGTVVGPRPVGGSRRGSVFLVSFLCLEKIAGQVQPVFWASSTAHHNILAFFRGKSWSSNRATCCWRVSLPAIFSTRTNPASNETLFRFEYISPWKSVNLHINLWRDSNLISLSYLLGLLGQATETNPQEIQVQQRSGICWAAAPKLLLAGT